MANTLAYHNTATITAVKSFIVQVPGSKLTYFLAEIVIVWMDVMEASNVLEDSRPKPRPGANLIKLFLSVIYGFS